MSSKDDLSPVPELSEIDRRCLALAANGRTPALRSAIDKLGARNMTGAITRAVRLDLL